MPDNIRLLQTMPFRQLDKWYVEYYLNTKKLNSKFKIQCAKAFYTDHTRKKANKESGL